MKALKISGFLTIYYLLWCLLTIGTIYHTIIWHEYNYECYIHLEAFDKALQLFIRGLWASFTIVLIITDVFIGALPIDPDIRKKYIKWQKEKKK